MSENTASSTIQNTDDLESTMQKLSLAISLIGLSLMIGGCMAKFFGGRYAVGAGSFRTALTDVNPDAAGVA